MGEVPIRAGASTVFLAVLRRSRANRGVAVTVLMMFL